MKFLEKDLEQIIYDADKELLAKKGLNVKGKLFRQIRIGNYGIADLVTCERPYYDEGFSYMAKGLITVYELKQDKIGISAFLQALGYLQGIKSFLSTKNKEFDFNYRIVLIGKELDTNSTYSYIANFLNLEYTTHVLDECKFIVENYTYSYDIDGISFNIEANYDLIDKGF